MQRHLTLLASILPMPASTVKLMVATNLHAHRPLALHFRPGRYCGLLFQIPGCWSKRGREDTLGAALAEVLGYLEKTVS